MRVLLISGNREDSDLRVPALGLACIAASAEAAGHEVRLHDLLIEKDPRSAVAEAVRGFHPDIIGISVRNIDDQKKRGTRFLLDQALETVTWCREVSAAPIVLGGAGFSIIPGPALDYLGADMGIQGEGEIVFPELLRHLQKGESIDNLPGLYVKGRRPGARRAFARDLDALPLPHPSLLARALAGGRDAPVPVQTRRGCPLFCGYCSTPTIEGNRVRWRSPAAVVAWMTRWVEEGFRNFYFVDNTFNLPPSYARHLCHEIVSSRLDISWRCILFPAALDPELAEAMAMAGCREVSMGFESGDEDVLRRMKKRYALDAVRRTSSLLRRNNIRRVGFLLLGGPGETRESVLESLAFADALELDALKLSVGIRIYPNTDLSRLAKDEGLIASDEDLLAPRFYVTRDLEEWIYDTLAPHLSLKPHWSF
jgi:radical SAM superfamily enzyme YgiQ (UPF0313 family)